MAYVRNFLILMVLKFIVIISVSKSQELCDPIKYLSSGVKDKPELLVLEKKSIGSINDDTLDGLCLISSSASETKRKPIIEPEKNALKFFAYDPVDGDVYIFDTFRKIIKLNLGNGERKVVYDFETSSVFSRGEIHSVTLDWVTKNLFLFFNRNLILIDLKDNSKYPKTLTTLENEKFTSPDVQVFPNDGYLVAKTDDGQLTRLDQDGLNPLVLYTNTAVKILDMVVDYYEKNVYWIEADDTQKNQIRYVNIQGGIVKNLNLEGRESKILPFLTVDEKYIYYIADRHLLRSSKADKIRDSTFDLANANETFLFDFVSILDKQRVVINHPCKVNNGGCRTGYCVAVPHESGRLAGRCLENKWRSVIQKNNLSLSNFVQDFYRNEIYIFDDTNSIRKIRLDSEEESAVDTPVNLPNDSRAFDWVTKNLYFFDGKNLDVINLGLKNVYFKGLLNLNILLDPPIVKVLPNDGYLIVKTDDGTLTRFNQDGSNPLLLYKSSHRREIKAVAVDYNSKTIYWLENNYAENTVEINHVNYNGEKMQSFSFSGNRFSYNLFKPYLDVDEDYIYFILFSTEDSNFHLLRISKQNQVLDSEFDIADIYEEFWYFFMKATSRQGIDHNSQCQYNNGGCREAVCVVIPDNEDLVTRCIGRDWHNRIKLNQETPIRDFLYDSYDSVIYKLDNTNQIKRVRLDNGQESVAYELPKEITGNQITSASLDWITKNLYFFYTEDLDVISLKNSSIPPKSLFYSLVDFDLPTPLMVRVMPNDGYLVAKVGACIIHRINEDGSDTKDLYNNRQCNIVALAADEHEKHVYWMEYSDKWQKPIVKYVDLNGNEGGYFNFEGNGLKYSTIVPFLAVDKDYVYVVGISNRDSSIHLLRTSKVGQVHDQGFDVVGNHEKFWPFDMEILNEQKIVDNHPCKNSNGGCESDFCVAVPGGIGKLDRRCQMSDGVNHALWWSNKPLFDQLRRME